MKLVVTFSWGNITCAGWSDIPVEYESEEALAINLEIAVEDWLGTSHRDWTETLPNMHFTWTVSLRMENTLDQRFELWRNGSKKKVFLSTSPKSNEVFNENSKA